MRVLRLIACFCLLAGVLNPTYSEARPCGSNQSCFEFIADATSAANGTKIWGDRTPPTLGRLITGWEVVINGLRNTLVGHTLIQPVFTSQATILNPAAVLQDGTNSISLNLNGGESLTGTGFLLYYHRANSQNSKFICRGRLNHDSYNQVDCGNIRIDLSEIDPDLYRQIENVKSEIRAHNFRALQPNSDELSAKNDEREYQNQLNRINGRIEAINAALAQLDFSDFDNIRLEDLAQLIAEDASIRTLYEGLKNTVDQIKQNIQTEIQSNQNRINETLNALQATFRDADTVPVHFDFVQAANGNSSNAFQAPLFANEGNIQTQAVGQGSQVQIEYENQLQGAGIQAIERLESALRKGDGAEFQAVFSAWNSAQQRTIQALQQNGASGATLRAAQQSQERVLNFVRSRVDLYGFFNEARIPNRTKQILAEKLKAWDESISRDLIDELNSWQDELNPVQQRIIQEIDSLEQVLDRLSDPRMQSDSGDPKREQAKEMARLSLKEGLLTLVKTAQISKTDSALTAVRSLEQAGTSTSIATEIEEYQTEAGELLSEVRAAIHVAQTMADFALGLVPVVGTSKDFYEAIFGENFLTGEPLSLGERVFTATSGVFALATLGGTKFITGPLKYLGKVMKKPGQAAGRGMQAAHQVQEVTRGVDKVVDATKKLGIKEASQIKNLADLSRHTGKSVEEITHALKGAKGKVGLEFEEHLSRALGGKGGFSAGRPVPNAKMREFDGAIGNVWYEAKSGGYWSSNYGGKGLSKFKSDMGERLVIASENGKEYQLISNTLISEEAKSWLVRKGIKFFEILE